MYLREDLAAAACNIHHGISESFHQNYAYVWYQSYTHMGQFLAQKPASIQDLLLVIALTPYFYPGDHPPCLCLDRDLGLNVPLLTIYIPSAPFMPKSIAHMYIYYLWLLLPSDGWGFTLLRIQ